MRTRRPRLQRRRIVWLSSCSPGDGTGHSAAPTVKLRSYARFPFRPVPRLHHRERLRGPAGHGQAPGGEDVVRTSRPVSRILSPVRAGGRPSIWAHRRRVPRAVHPQARASSPRTPAQPHREVRSSTLLRAGFTEPPRSPGALVRSYRTVSPLPHGPRGPWAVCFLWHCPAGHPGLPLATALLCGVRTFLGTERDTTGVSVPGAATARPTHPPPQDTRWHSAAHPQSPHSCQGWMTRPGR